MSDGGRKRRRREARENSLEVRERGGEEGAVVSQRDEKGPEALMRPRSAPGEAEERREDRRESSTARVRER